MAGWHVCCVDSGSSALLLQRGDYSLVTVRLDVGAGGREGIWALSHQERSAAAERVWRG